MAKEVTCLLEPKRLSLKEAMVSFWSLFTSGHLMDQIHRDSSKVKMLYKGQKVQPSTAWAGLIIFF